MTWQVARGHIRESDLFTGEIVDVGIMSAMEGWDTFKGWSDAIEIPAEEDPKESGSIYWVAPVLYHTDITPQLRQEKIAIEARAMTPPPKESLEADDPQNFASPIGKLLPSEIPPILPIERFAPEVIHDLGSGRWLFDFGRAL